MISNIDQTININAEIKNSVKSKELKRQKFIKYFRIIKAKSEQELIQTE